MPNTPQEILVNNIPVTFDQPYFVIGNGVLLCEADWQDVDLAHVRCWRFLASQTATYDVHNTRLDDALDGARVWAQARGALLVLVLFLMDDDDEEHVEPEPETTDDRKPVAVA